MAHLGGTAPTPGSSDLQTFFMEVLIGFTLTACVLVAGAPQNANPAVEKHSRATARPPGRVLVQTRPHQRRPRHRRHRPRRHLSLASPHPRTPPLITADPDPHALRYESSPAPTSPLGQAQQQIEPVLGRRVAKRTRAPDRSSATTLVKGLLATRKVSVMVPKIAYCPRCPLSSPLAGSGGWVGRCCHRRR